ncbi:MAG: hypothetical protein QOD77_413 [Thermoplasmata archaeon]|jgi:hypothetical protein|nr:hypothetical protein [Thermoplasmata archaeon]
MNGLEHLVEGLFDYAGMFPPAQLDLRAALRESARSSDLIRPGIVGNAMVVPYPQLHHITDQAVVEAGFGDRICTVCVVGVSAEKVEEAAREVHGFNQARDHARVVTLETHAETIPAAPLLAAAKALSGIQLYVEPTWIPKHWLKQRDDALAFLNQAKATGHGVGLKVRGAGEQAVTKQLLATLIQDVAHLRIPFKVTQGLHHPILEPRHKNRHGFVNAAAALRLRQVHGAAFGRAAIREMLRENKPNAYDFTNGIAWRTYRMDLAQLRAVKAGIPFAVGSCSLQEPDADLARLWPPSASPTAVIPKPRRGH